MVESTTLGAKFNELWFVSGVILVKRHASNMATNLDYAIPALHFNVHDPDDDRFIYLGFTDQDDEFSINRSDLRA